MKIIVYGNNEDSKELFNRVSYSLEELGLSELIDLEKSNDSLIKDKLINLTFEPAILIEEDAIDFLDVIVQGVIPSDDDIKSMLISIIGGKGESGCDTELCGNGCFC